MRVVHKHREILTAIDTLQAPGDALELCNAPDDRSSVDIESNGDRYPSQQVVDIMASHQGRGDLELPLRGGQGEMNTVKSMLHRKGLQRRFALQTIGQQTRLRHMEEALAIGIIEVENMPHG